MEAKDEAICPKSGSIDTGVFDVGNHFLVFIRPRIRRSILAVKAIMMCCPEQYLSCFEVSTLPDKTSGKFYPQYFESLALGMWHYLMADGRGREAVGILRHITNQRCSII
jgi:hypothetical protein